MIILPASPQDDLDWNEQLKKAEKASAPILWAMDFQFGTHPFKDMAAFNAYTLALDQFVKQVWEPYAEKTAGLSLYRGSADVTALFDWDQEEFAQWLADEFPQEEAGDHYFQLYGMRSFSEYLHRLVSVLPENLKLFASFDGTGIPHGTLAYLINKERFPTIQVTHSTYDKTAFVLPSHASLSHAQRVPEIPRIIPESLLAEEWEGCETLLILPDSLGTHGKRCLQGFQAAGGIVKQII